MTPFWDWFLQRKATIGNHEGQRLLALYDQSWRDCTEEDLEYHIISAHFSETSLFAKGIAEFDIAAAAARGFTLQGVVEDGIRRIGRYDKDILIPDLKYPIRPTPEDYRIGIGMNLRRIHELCSTAVPYLGPLPADVSQYTTEIQFSKSLNP